MAIVALLKKIINKKKDIEGCRSSSWKCFKHCVVISRRRNTHLQTLHLWCRVAKLVAPVRICRQVINKHTSTIS